MNASYAFKSKLEEEVQNEEEKVSKINKTNEDNFMSSSLNSLSSSSSCNSLLNIGHTTNQENKNEKVLHSLSSIETNENTWKASSLGIKCISYKPNGYVFLTRRILDKYSTDGKRKLEILYNYSKNCRNEFKIPKSGTSLENCSFCDTVTLDFDPDSTLFDLVMEVQIITQGAKNDKNKDKIKRKRDEENQSNSSDSENETTIVSSSYDLKYQKIENEPKIEKNRENNFTGKRIKF